MKKRIALVLMVCVAGVTMAGCSGVPDMTEEEETIIAEYAANTLLKYDKNYNSRYEEDVMAEIKASSNDKKPEETKAPQEEKTVEPKATDSPTPTPVPETAQETDPAQEETAPPQVKATPTPLSEKMSPYDIGKLFGVEGVEVNYIGFEAVDTYPVAGQEQLAFTMNAAQGTKLIVTKFELINNTEVAKNCNIAGQNIKFQMLFNAADYVAVQKTLLTDDFAALNCVLQPGESRQVVVVSQVSAGYETTITNVDLIVRIGGENTLLKLQ